MEFLSHATNKRTTIPLKKRSNEKMNRSQAIDIVVTVLEACSTRATIPVVNTLIKRSYRISVHCRFCKVNAIM